MRYARNVPKGKQAFRPILFEDINPDEIDELELEIAIKEKERERAEELGGDWGATSPLLWFFVESTSNIKLDPWQRVLCDRLQALAGQTGKRLLIHAPPQAGKSVIVSQRFPAWLLGIKPTDRVKLACYNVTHAANFGGVVRDVMTGADYHHFFPSPRVVVPERSPKESFSTDARARLKDAQPSFKALGLATGFVGQGAEHLLIDDPYASPQEAYSPIIRENVWTFWSASAKVRLKDDANVVVMFHRYHEDDLAGRMWAERNADGSRVWELLRFAAIADADPEMPDPMGRQAGEKLSPRMSEAYIAEQQKNALIWAGQFQGKPTPTTGAFFDSAWFTRERIAPLCPGVRRIRYWDIAGAKPGQGDWTVGVLLFRDPATGYFWIEDIQRFQKPSNERNAHIKETAKADSLRGCPVKTVIEQAPGLSKEATDILVRELAEFATEADPVRVDKVTRAEPLQSQARAGNVKIKDAPNVSDFLSVLSVFPFGSHDDDVDAASGAFLWTVRVPEPADPVTGSIPTRPTAWGSAPGLLSFGR